MKLFNWIKQRFSHKLEHLKWANVKNIFRENGLALVVIIVGWEIVEDVLFPAIFALLGKYIHPAFFAGIPVAWVICLHWLMVPFLWGIWIKFKKSDKNLKHDCGSCDESR
jgi:hypothetical protein